MTTIGVLLAGGSGRRLASGGLPKACVEFDGSTLVERALATLLQVCSQVIVVAPELLTLPVPTDRAPDIIRMADPPGDGGPLVALAAALSSRPFKLAFVMGVDFPFVTAETLRAVRTGLAVQRRLMRRLALARVAEGTPPRRRPLVCVPSPGGMPQPLVSVLHPAATRRLSELVDAGERSVTAAFERLRPHYLSDSMLKELGVSSDDFFNVNTPEDLAQARERLDSATTARAIPPSPPLSPTAESGPDGELWLGGRRVAQVHAELQASDPTLRAFWAYDMQGLRERATRLRNAFGPLTPLIAYAMKANSWPPILNALAEEGFGAEAGSLGELELAEACGIPAERRILNGNGRTPEEADWVAQHGVHCVNADSIDELDLLHSAAVRHARTIRVAIRVNPNVPIAGHPYVATGHGESKFGVSPKDALGAWRARSRWPRLNLDGLHIHIGSQILDARPLEQALTLALDVREQAAGFGHLLKLINLGGGFGIDYDFGRREFPIEDYAKFVTAVLEDTLVQVVLEPGRWVVGPIGVLVAEVLNVKLRGEHRFVVLAAGMNDLIRPALYNARHRIVPVSPRAGAWTDACVVGPVCESGDQFDSRVSLPPLERGDLVAILDAGAYGASMSSTYNGRPRLREVGIE
ncbi:MAG: diaminopimelate decarboxylase [Candidatus Eisenbacteria bacterium]|uniref:Probable molybdenum cofactor guanylyltransferase n=1 Tax=Eiseniibacteriota bacterium TaxID=2212470 RepID=A0A849SU47_UNCEI|nr:diaminopimelate decarboxylase [Candidatus Eisenbacteria bacterium]